MGDNRTNSEDSRYFGPIPGSLIVGKMAFKVWPLDRTTWLVALSVMALIVLVLLLLALRAPAPPRPGRVRPAVGRPPGPAAGRARPTLDRRPGARIGRPPVHC